MNLRPLFIFTIIYLIFNTSTQSQDSSLSNDEIANQISNIYPDASFYGLESSLRIRFKYDSKNRKVNAKIKINETLLCISKSNQIFRGSIFLNDQTKTSLIRIGNPKGHNQLIRLTASNYKSEGIFYDDIKVKQFTIPFESKGDQDMYDYTISLEDIKYLTNSFFHTYYPLKSKTIVFEIPSWLDADLAEFNFENFNVEKNETSSKSGNRTITYTLKDLPPINNEKFASDFSTSLPHVILISKSFNKKDEKITLLESTQDLYNWYALLNSEVENNPDIFKEKVANLTSGNKSEKEKIEALFYWVQDNIRYIAYEDGIMGFKAASAQHVYEKKYGDCKGMANLTCEMLKLAGFDARLSWLGTRSIPYTYELPSLAVDNHMICTVYLGEDKYFLDATEKGISIGDYAHRIQGQDILIENGDSYIIDTIPNRSSLHNSEKTNSTLILNGEMINGKARKTSNGESKTNFYHVFNHTAHNEQEDLLNEWLIDGNKNLSISNIQTKGLDNRKDSLIINYEVQFKNQVTTIAKELFINTNFSENLNQWSVETYRIQNMNFGYKRNEEISHTLTIPKEYNIEYLPKAIFIDNKEFKINLSINYEESKHQLVFTRKFEIKKGNITQSYFKEWNTAIDRLNAFYSDQIILKKP